MNMVVKKKINSHKIKAPHLDELLTTTCKQGGEFASNLTTFS
jgi:hypothetical protein